MLVHQECARGQPRAGAYRSCVVRCPMLIGVSEYREGKRRGQAWFEEQFHVHEWVGCGRPSVKLKEETRVREQQKEEKAEGYKYLAANNLAVLPKGVTIPNFPASSENCQCDRAQHVNPKRERRMRARNREVLTPIDVPRDQSVQCQIGSCPQ